MDTLQDQILKRIHQAGPGRVFTPKDFLDLVGRDATDQALSRLVRRGVLKRLARGLYYTPKHNPALGIDVPAELDEIAEALGRQTGSRVVPSGAVAANQLGLSTQVPAKPVYLSDGHSRKVQVGRYTIHIKHVPPKDLPGGDRKTAMVVQALRFLGRDAVNDQVIRTIRRALSADERKRLQQEAKYVTDWVCDVVRDIAQSEERPDRG